MCFAFKGARLTFSVGVVNIYGQCVCGENKEL